MDAEKLKELVTWVNEDVTISNQGYAEIPHAEESLEAAYKAGMQEVVESFEKAILESKSNYRLAAMEQCLKYWRNQLKERGIK